MSDREALNRRDFMQGAALTLGTLAMVSGVEELHAAPEDEDEAPSSPAVGLGLIGVGDRGRELLAAMARMKNAPVVALCDTFEPMLKRGKEVAPKAATYPDHHRLLDDKKVEAVFIATPSHQHKEIALAAIQAGKHVYCEAPLASTIEDAKAIAYAGKGSKKVFQVGQQNRANPQHHHVNKFMKLGVLGKTTQARAQWHKRVSWREPHPNSQRQREINWRLDPAVSPGLLGEIGIHQIDVASWYFRSLPQAVLGFGSVTAWTEDDRQVPDTVQAIFQYPNGVRLVYDATLGNSFDRAYELFMGTESAILMRGERAWLVKENDAPILGWEVYARKDTLAEDTGIVLVADATKLLKMGLEPGKAESTTKGKDATYFAVEDFLTSIRKNTKSRCGPVEGFQAAVVAIKANEAILSGTKIAYQKEWFTLP
jgi:predicted dehydrogenase